MISRFSHYKMAVFLAALLAGINLLYLVSVVWRYGEFGQALVIAFVMVPLIIALGLWLQSKIARYLGAAWFLLISAIPIWVLFFWLPKSALNISIVWNIAFVLYALTTVLGLVLAYLMLFSKRFAKEFADEREKQPPYKATLRKIIVSLLIAATVAATAYDIYRIVYAS